MTRREQEALDLLEESMISGSLWIHQFTSTENAEQQEAISIQIIMCFIDTIGIYNDLASPPPKKRKKNE